MSLTTNFVPPTRFDFQTDSLHGNSIFRCLTCLAFSTLDLNERFTVQFAATSMPEGRAQNSNDSTRQLIDLRNAATDRTTNFHTCLTNYVHNCVSNIRETENCQITPRGKLSEIHRVNWSKIYRVQLSNSLPLNTGIPRIMQIRTTRIRIMWFFNRFQF